MRLERCDKAHLTTILHTARDTHLEVRENMYCFACSTHYPCSLLTYLTYPLYPGWEQQKDRPPPKRSIDFGYAD